MRIQVIYIHNTWLLSCRIVLLSSHIPTICPRSHQIVLRHGYARKHILRLIHLIVKLKFLYACLDGADRVTCVIDCECLRISEDLRKFTQKSDEHRMECTHIQSPRPSFPYHQSNPFLHLRSCLLRKGQRQNSRRINTLRRKDIGNPACQNSCLSRSRTRYYQHRSVHTTDSSHLLAVQPL